MACGEVSAPFDVASLFSGSEIQSHMGTSLFKILSVSPKLYNTLSTSEKEDRKRQFIMDTEVSNGCHFGDAETLSGARGCFMVLVGMTSFKCCM